MSSKNITFPEWSKPLVSPARYKGAKGGRGGGKSHFFGEYAILRAYESKRRILCAREIQNSIKDSVKHLLEKKIEKLGLSSFFHITRDEIVGKNGSRFIFRGLRDQNADSLKSVEDVDYCWVEEAQTISQHSLDILTPTIFRKDDAEIWFSWNPRNKEDAVENLFTDDLPDSVLVSVNYPDNPFLPEILRDEAEYCKRTDFAKYQHVWGGGYMTITEGSFYAKEMLAIHNEGRLCEWDLQDKNDHNGVCVAWDLGRNDYTSMWFYKIIGGGEVHIIDFYENRFEHIDHYIDILKEKPYNYDCQIMPHDAKNKHLEAIKSSYEYVRDAGFKVEVLKVTKSVLDDIEAVRRILPLCHFYKPNCERGTDHLMAYRRKQNATTGIYEETHVHDESSHAADAFRQLARKHPLNAKSRKVGRRTLGGL